MIIYKAQNKINGKIYIGVTTKTIDRRISAHRYSRDPFGRALQKYGMDNFDITILDSVLFNEVGFEKEKYWIKKHKSKVPQGYNITDGGEGRPGIKQTEEQIKKRVKHYKGKSRPEWVKEKIKNTLMGHPVLESTKEKIRKSTTGRKRKSHPVSEETRKKLSKSLTGRKNPHIGYHGPRKPYRKKDER